MGPLPRSWVLCPPPGGLPALGLELQSQRVPGGPVVWAPGAPAARPALRVCAPRPAVWPRGHPPAGCVPAGLLLAENDPARRAHHLLRPRPGARRVHEGRGVGTLFPLEPLARLRLGPRKGPCVPICWTEARRCQGFSLPSLGPMFQPVSPRVSPGMWLSARVSPGRRWGCHV